jgi:hypothetical protein
MRVRNIAGRRTSLNWLTIKYTAIHAIQKYGPVAQPGRVPDFYHFGRNPAVSGSNPDGPVNYSGSYTCLKSIIEGRELKKNDR